MNTTICASTGSTDIDSDGDNNNNIAERTYVRSRLYRNKLSLTHLAEVDDDYDFDMEGLGDDSHFCELFPKARPGTNTVRFIKYKTD